MKLLLVDDEPLVLKLLDRAVAEALPGEERNCFTSATKAMAFAEMNRIDIAFLDINMRVMDGLTMAKALRDRYPKINIIFCTGYPEYAVGAMRLYCSAYLMKPVTVGAVKEALANLRYPIEQKPRVRFQCFGNFEVFCDEKPVEFHFRRTKELLAYLVDRNGASCTAQQVLAAAFEDSISRVYLYQLRGDLMQTLETLGVSDIIDEARGSVAIRRDRVACDYYDYLDGKTDRKPTEYMTQYSFGEYTLATLLNG